LGEGRVYGARFVQWPGATVTAASLYRTYLDWVDNEHALSTVPKGKMFDSLMAFGVEAAKSIERKESMLVSKVRTES
jgi:hypothetical protein